ncbi:MAG: AAA family ATPase [Candidatus Eisenbacteria sp.]|nr:AAA family ATPase [Candidatus Eisenbacteria bacterium]
MKSPKNEKKAALKKHPAARASASQGIDLSKFEVPVSQMRWHCNLECFGFKTTAELPEFEGIIGQDRAIEAISLGLKMRSKGYNIYVAGLSGTGKMTTVKHLLANLESQSDLPSDVVYVNNFRDPDRPRAILLPAGQGNQLRKDMEGLVINMRRNIAQIYESDVYKERMKALVEEYKDREKTILREFEGRISTENFALIQIQMGPFSKPEIAPVIAGEPVQMEKLDGLTRQEKFNKEEFARLKAMYEELTGELEKVFKAARDLKHELRDVMEKLQKEFGSPAVTDYIQDLKIVHHHPEEIEYLNEVQDEILSNMERFTDGGEEHEKKSQESPGKLEDRFRDFAVNVLVDNSKTKKPPVIVETSPNYRNLFGTIERAVDRTGHWVADFTKIKAGSLLRANGGILVLNLMDAIVEAGVWVALKRALKHQKIDIQSFDPFYVLSVSALKPEPIDLDVKIIVMGDRHAYHLLYNFDEDFGKIFKVKAEFDTVMPRSQKGVEKYMNFARKITADEGLLPMNADGLASLIEHGVRLGGRRSKISTRFSIVADVIRESDLWAREVGAGAIGEEHVDRALQAREARVNLAEEKTRDLVEEGILLIDTDGEKVGQVNGLSVLDLGDYAFGQPSRITVKTSLGRDGIVNIEREAKMSGKTHDKGVLILEGYFRSLFTDELPLALNATICFEQNYGGIDGDSASSTEIYALLSALAGVPIRQDIAVTGSVNQNGEIQPIGGVNEKIEGFFDVCKARGLTGKQGVMIPRINVDDLMLCRRVLEAVERGEFHVWAVTTIPEGIEILTSMPVGFQGGDGKYPPNTLFGRVSEKVNQYAQKLKAFGAKDEKEA